MVNFLVVQPFALRLLDLTQRYVPSRNATGAYSATKGSSRALCTAPCACSTSGSGAVTHATTLTLTSVPIAPAQLRNQLLVIITVYSALRICFFRAIASSTACSGLMPSAATRWTAFRRRSPQYLCRQIKGGTPVEACAAWSEAGWRLAGCRSLGSRQDAAALSCFGMVGAHTLAEKLR